MSIDIPVDFFPYGHVDALIFSIPRLEIEDLG